MFDIKMVTTDKGNRRSGLGTDLLRRSVQLASSLGYKVTRKKSSDSQVTNRQVTHILTTKTHFDEHL